MKNTGKWTLIISSIFLLVYLYNNKQLASRIFGELKYRTAPMDPGTIEVPHERTLVWKSKSAFAENAYRICADKPLAEAELHLKNNAPRILLAKLLLKEDIPEVNRKLMKLAVWGNCGSSWALNKKGNYDFALVVLTTIYGIFGDQPELLYPETKDYLFNVLLMEEGNKFSYTAPRTLGLVVDTENHMLMTEGPRYLKNQWLRQQGNMEDKYDNLKNGMEHKLLVFMEEMKTAGLDEFNSLPYAGYTITGLLAIEAFASEKLSREARNVLDYMNWCYALGSYQLKHYPPMRRRYSKAGIQELTTDYHSAFMKAWLSYSDVENYDTDISHAEVHAAMGACMPYRPADEVVEMIFNKGNGYFVKIGHGQESCPEIYSAGKHFLLSAGGVNRGERSLIVTRPTTLFLNNTATNLAETFHLAGPGTDFMKWNNTGVYRNFACAAGPVSIPRGVKPVAEKNNWSVYSRNDSISVVVYSTEKFGLMAVFEGFNPKDLLEAILKENSDSKELSQFFQFPNGHKLSYDVNSPEEKWVIISDNGQLLDRDFDKWPLIDGDFKNENN